MSKQRHCGCFGDSGVHASTHEVDGVQCCDLCGWPIASGSRDALSVINDTVTIPRAEYEALMAATRSLKELVEWWEKPGFLLETDQIVEERMNRARAALRAAGIDPSEDKA